MDIGLGKIIASAIRMRGDDVVCSATRLVEGATEIWHTDRAYWESTGVLRVPATAFIDDTEEDTDWFCGNVTIEVKDGRVRDVFCGDWQPEYTGPDTWAMEEDVASAIEWGIITTADMESVAAPIVSVYDFQVRVHLDDDQTGEKRSGWMFLKAGDEYKIVWDNGAVQA